MKKVKLKKKLSLVLAVIMMLGMFVPIGSEKGVSAKSATVTSSGSIRLPGASSKVGKFKIDGKRAFCIQHTKLHPPSGSTMSGSPYKNPRIAKALYYGWAGVKPWSGFKAGSQGSVRWSKAEHGIVLTSLLLSCYYNGDSPGSYSYIRGFSSFKRYVESKPNIVSNRVYFSKEKLTAAWSSSLNLQKTSKVKIKGDSGASMKFTLPKGVTMVNAATGAKDSGTVRAKVGKTYYFTAKGNVTGTYKTGKIGKNWKFQPLVFKKSGAGIQDIAKGDKVIDPNSQTSLSIKWANLGSGRVIKKSESGKRIAGAKFKLTSGSVKRIGTTNSKGEVVFSGLLPGKYTVSEESVPAPYILDKRAKTINVSMNKETSVSFTNKYARGEFSLEKKDVGGRNLKGAVFKIWSEGKDPEGNAINYSKEFTADENGKIKVSGLKLGKYNYREVKAPEGFVLDKATYSFSLKYKDQKTSVVKASGVATNEQVTFYKTDTLHRILSGGKFEILNKNGKKIGEFKGIFKDNGKFIEGSSGIALNGLAEGEEYTIREVEAPLGYGISKDVKFTVSKAKENMIVVMIDDKSRINTTALDSDTNDHISNADSDVTINDTVAYENLIPGKEYEMKGTLMDKATGKVMRDDNGKEITAKSKFTASQTGSGSVVVTFKFSGKLLEGKSAVVFETLKKDGKEVAIHHDINDANQSIDFPKLVTKANVSKDLKKVSDRVEYSNLIPGKSYRLKGWLVNKKTGEKLKGSETYKEFTPQKSSGSVTITLNSEQGINGKYVVFEECYMDGKLIGKHKDINDTHQMVDLSVGKVVIKAPKQSGSSVVATGDSFSLKLLFFFFIAGGIGSVIMLVNKRSRKQKDE